MPMAEPRSMLFKSRRVGLNKRFAGGPPLTQVNGRSIQPAAKRQKVESPSSSAMSRELNPLYDPITAPPESSGDEAENAVTKQPAGDDISDSDEEYARRRNGDIRGTFNKPTSSGSGNAESARPKTRALRSLGGKSSSSSTEDDSSLAGSKRSAGEDRPKQVSQLERELETPRQRKKKKPPLMKYGLQQKIKNQSASAFDDDQDIVSPVSAKRPFQHIKNISPAGSPSPRKSFKITRQSPYLVDPEDSELPKPKFRSVPRHSTSPLSTPGKPRMRRTSLVDESIEEQKPKAVVSKAKMRRSTLFGPRGSKARKPSPDSTKVEFSQRPVFKVPGIEDFDSFDDLGSLESTATPGESQDASWDHLEVEELQSTTISRCPMCHEEVDSELLEKHSNRGKMSVKQQTAFCRLHKRLSAAAAGTEKGYPEIDWEALDSRCGAHRGFLQNILEGKQASHYRNVLKERVDSGKNRTLLTSQDNLTPGYYGPRGLQVMTEFIMGALSDVIRRRAVEDKLISARSYTGYVQTVLVPELAVRLIMEDMSVTEERAREVLMESVEIGELLYEEDRDVVRIEDNEEDTFLET
ncbi:RTC4-like domain-containing protein [Nemania sp. NC0429]|nr:RTC4-like domain-containing protein [Nemania sp. NC0429]